MRVIKCKNYDEVSEAAARIVAAQVTMKPDCILGLPTGSTPLGMYSRLIQMNKENKLDFSKIKTFNLDEYFPISKDNNQSYHYFMFENFFNHININKENVNIPNGETDNPEGECVRYEEAIGAAGGIDLQVLGIGQNGHIGFNEPDDYLESATHITSLTQNTIEANSRFFDSMDDVPKKALTTGMGTILKSRKIIILASGKVKAEAVRSLLSGKITTQNPSTMLNLHSDVTLIADEDALS
ncbi:MAG: glucosamine-6-phosphate deaminase [Eubacteriales bacterium]|nr:glucosamine-6-phosphate deaminase [Eubacteriales bacterium]